MIDPHTDDPTEEEQEWGRWIHAHAVYPDGRRPPAEPPRPSRIKSALGFVETASRVITGAIRGEPIYRTPEHEAACLDVCRHGAGLAPDQIINGHCDRWRPSDDRCGSMQGCDCIAKQAARYRQKKCPLGRWPVEVPSEEP